MDYNKIEDAVFKKAMEIFKESAAEFFGLDIIIDRPAETEIKNIDIKTNAMDYLFYTNEGNYMHFEFQTTNKQYDLSRFLYYDASLYYKNRKQIRTLVVYSADIKEVNTNLKCGSIDYNVEVFYMNKLDGDKRLEEITYKIENGIELTKNDIISLSFIPLMHSVKTKSDLTIDSIEAAKDITDEKAKTNSLTLLYALFDKFGDEKAKKRFKEVISMTEVGKMIYNDGVEAGIEKGMEKGIELEKIENAKNFLRLGIAENVVAQGTGLSIEHVRKLKKELHLN